MQVTKKSRLALRVHSGVLLLLLIGAAAALAVVSTRYTYTADWTSSGRYTLSEASKALLKTLTGPVEITAYASEDVELRDGIKDLIELYTEAKPDIVFRFVNPDTVPDQLRELNVTAPGELIVSYAGRSEHVIDHSEEDLSNALQRLLRGKEQWVVFLKGHGERDPAANANHDYGRWGRQLENRGFKVQTLTLADTPTIPDNTAVLVIASPQVALLPGEVELIQAYLNRGGNLLWIADPGSLGGLDPLAEKLGVTFQAGTLVDPATRLFGIDQPTMVLVTSYGSQPPLQGFRYVTIFPNARAVKDQGGRNGWQAAGLLTTGKQAWAETGKLEGSIKLDEGQDLAGPLDIGITLTRARSAAADKKPDGKDEKADQAPTGSAQQRIIVLGDGDFVSNKYLANSGNLDLGVKLMNWLATDDKLLDIPAHTSSDTALALSDTAGFLLWFLFTLFLPIALGVTGLSVWLHRRNA